MGLDDFTETTNSDNRHVFCEKDKTDSIVRGGTSTHIFTLFFDYRTTCREADWFEITYKQSLGLPDALEQVFDVQSPTVSISVENDITKVSVNITPELSVLFDPARITFAQIKLYLKDGTVIYGDKNYINVIDTLNSGD